MTGQWMTVNEAAEYTRRHYKTVLAAAQLYRRTRGERGLESYQPQPRSHHRIPLAGVERWIRGEPPRRAHVARAA